MTQERIQQIFKQTNAVITDSHIVYTSGRHGSDYVNKDALYPNPCHISELSAGIVYHFMDDRKIGVDYEVVVGPEKGAIILATWTAYNSVSRQPNRPPILGIYAEKDEYEDRFVLRRGYDKLVKNKKVLIVEDVTTTGGTIKKVVQEVVSKGGKVIGVGLICNRGQVTAEQVGNVPDLYALVNINMESWPAKDCPLCRKGVPINVEVGKGLQYLATQAEW